MSIAWTCIPESEHSKVASVKRSILYRIQHFLQNRTLYQTCLKHFYVLLLFTLSSYEAIKCNKYSHLKELSRPVAIPALSYRRMLLEVDGTRKSPEIYLIFKSNFRGMYIYGFSFAPYLYLSGNRILQMNYVMMVMIPYIQYYLYT